MIDRTANARWEGTLKDGNGTMRLGSGAFEGKYSFGSRFEQAPGTNPEELIGAAHAGCFSMAFANALSQAGHPPTSIETKAVVHLDRTDAGFAIVGIDLATKAVVPGVSPGDFARIANEAKAGCPVSKALASVPITLDAVLAG